MLKEILTEDRIVLNLKGDFREAVDQLLEKMSSVQHADSIRKTLLEADPLPFSYIKDNIAIPHLRIEKFPAPSAVLGISEEGVDYRGRKLNVILLLITPAEDPVLHLKLLQGLSSFIPAAAPDIISLKDPAKIIRTIAGDEVHSEYVSFINLTQEQVVFELQTDPVFGLSEKEAQSRLKEYGKNTLKKSASIPWYIRIVKDFFSFFALLLWISAILCFIPGVDMPQLGYAIFIVLFLNGIFSFLQEYKSDRSVEALQKLIGHTCRVLREGNQMEIKASSLVPGDVIFLEEGGIVPADARLIEASGIEVDNSALTGESNSVRRYKTDQPIVIHGKFLWNEMPNIVFSGSSLIQGNGKAVVFGTGMNSEIGKIAKLTQEIKHEKSPLQKQLKTTVFSIAALAFVIGLSFLFLSWLAAGLSFLQAFIFFIGIFVANVPEGLLPTVSLSLAMGVSRMAKRNAIIKDLSSVETLGCTTVICSDKTGTLTENLMSVTGFFIDGRMIQVKGTGYDLKAQFYSGDSEISHDNLYEIPSFKNFIECAYVCNNARLEKTERGNRIIGDPTEGSLVVLAARANFRGAHRRIYQNPFESVRKCMSVVIKKEGSREKLLYAKGAPLEILKKCAYIYKNNSVQKISEEDKTEVLKQVDEMASRGLRVLGLSFREDEELQNMSDYGIASVEKDMVFLGITGMSDPVRPGVPEAVKACHAAGIRIIMITGDYPLTAYSIGREIGMGEDSELKTISGTEISNMNDDTLREILKSNETVFARVSPEQKLRIVTLLKELGEIVAVTGDGVNDGPALKKADIGISMGKRGTDVAREASRIILTDDNFASIVAAVEEGRAVFENIKRFSGYVFSSNPQEIYPYLLWMVIPGFPLTMTVMGVLAVDVGTDLIPAMGLGIEPPEKGIMERPPRNKDEKLLSMSFILKNYFMQGSILAFASFATYFYFIYRSGFFKDGFSLSFLPPSPPDLNMTIASAFYLQSLMAYFIPTVTTQIANVMCRRSTSISLFSRNFIGESRRKDLLKRLREWHLSPYTVKLNINNEIASLNQFDALKLPFLLIYHISALPFRYMNLILHIALKHFERPIVRPLLIKLSGFLEKYYILLNLFSNPLINAGIAFELFCLYLLAYSPLSEIYYFSSVTWDVFLFAFHGTFILLIFEEIRKYFLRKRFNQSDN